MTTATTTPGAVQEYGPFVAVTGYEDALDLWEALHGHFLARRPARMTIGVAPRLYPETTVADVLMVAGLFGERLAKAPPDALGLPAARDAWLPYQAEIQQQIAGHLLHETFPDNSRFWRATRDLAIALSANAGLPTKADIVLDVLRGAGADGATRDQANALVTAFDSVTDTASDLVDRGGSAAKSLLSDVVDAAKAIGGGVKDTVKSGVEGASDAVIAPLVKAVGKPFLIGAAVVGGIILAPRLLDRGAQRAR